ncbi:hypothetical protein QJS83_13295 [Bdellovibrio sp. 22V]|uniref:hypothetical protein n=1 Tax=Bdellovibrio TaxID=958 RepID=UPI002543618F|nr:hypothetical protein [Bdellovibrio sp. 22V]WII71439.1 hypothetical protein QJS83_13295 [Bdellovibrio sp. 22V]
MSDGIIERQQNNSQDSSATTEKKESSRKSLFGNLNQDLKQALDSWDVLSEQMSNKLSPDEEQLLEVKRLLGELKSKLNEFGE